MAPNPILRATVLAEQVPQGAQNLDNMEYTASTMFHELFHLLLGPCRGLSIPPGGEVYNLGRLLGLAYDIAIINPESYSRLAIAYQITKSAPRNATGDPVELYIGYTTQG